MTRPLSLFLSTFVLAFVLSACSASQEGQRLPVTYYKSRCSYCAMLFQDERFGAEMRMVTDSVLVFDATECLVAYMLSNSIEDSRIKALWSVDYAGPAMLVDARKAYYLHSDKVSSPMEVNLAAFNSRERVDSVYAASGGEIVDWQGAVNVVRHRWFRGRNSP